MTLEEFLASNLDPRELKRAWPVSMGMQALKHREIPPMLGLHSSDLSPWESGYRWRWVSGVGFPTKAVLAIWITHHLQPWSTNGSKNAKDLWEVMD